MVKHDDELGLANETGAWASNEAHADATIQTQQFSSFFFVVSRIEQPTKYFSLYIKASNQASFQQPCTHKNITAKKISKNQKHQCPQGSLSMFCTSQEDKITPYK